MRGIMIKPVLARPRRGKILPLLALAACCGLAFSFPRPKEHPWGVYFSGLPENIFAELAGEDVVFYILKQTHEPVFRRDDGQNYSSRILKRWNRSVDSTRYSFCPDTSRAFDKDHRLSIGLFRKHLSAVTRKYSPDHRIFVNGDCVKVDFNKSRKGYLEYLTRYENAPTIRTGKNIETGLGEFYVEEISKEKVVLRRKKHSDRGYDSVVVREYGAMPDWNLVNQDLKDFNRVSALEVPRDVSARFLSFDSIPLKSVGLVINNPDSGLRKAIYNCMDIDGLRKAAFPGAREFYDIETILPVGVPGAKAGKPLQECGGRQYGKAPSRPLIFANWRAENQPKLQALARSFRERTGIKVEIRTYDPYELAKALYRRPHPYDLILIGFSVVQPEYDVFFKDILGKDGFVDFDLPRLSALRGEMLANDDEQGRAAIAARIAQGFSEEGALLPLYQEMHKFYYPAEIKNLMVGKNFTEYPEVADFKW